MLTRNLSGPVAEAFLAAFGRTDCRWTLSNPSVTALTGAVEALDAASNATRDAASDATHDAASGATHDAASNATHDAASGATHDAASNATLDVLGRNEVLREIRANFEIGCRAAELVAADRLRLRVADADERSTLLVAPPDARAVVTVGDTVAMLPVTDDGWTRRVHDELDAAVASADDYPLRKPPLSRVFETAAERLGDPFATDFADCLAHARDHGARDQVHAPTVALLVGAAHGRLQYDLSRWLEDSGVASSATASRYKTTLEERGLVTAERVSVDVGRPRQRLHLSEAAEERVAASSLEAFVLEQCAG